MIRQWCIRGQVKKCYIQHQVAKYLLPSGRRKEKVLYGGAHYNTDMYNLQVYSRPGPLDVMVVFLVTDALAGDRYLSFSLLFFIFFLQMARSFFSFNLRMLRNMMFIFSRLLINYT